MRQSHFRLCRNCFSPANQPAGLFVCAQCASKNPLPSPHILNILIQNRNKNRTILPVIIVPCILASLTAYLHRALRIPARISLSVFYCALVLNADSPEYPDKSAAPAADYPISGGTQAPSGSMLLTLRAAQRRFFGSTAEQLVLLIIYSYFLCLHLRRRSVIICTQPTHQAAGITRQPAFSVSREWST